MSGYTKGEWKYGADKCADNADAMRICKENIDSHDKPSSGWFWVVYLADGRRTALVGHGPDGEANARLIAAAPDLLEALKVARNLAVNGGFQLGWNVDRLDEAIAKATGDTT